MKKIVLSMVIVSIFIQTVCLATTEKESSQNIQVLSGREIMKSVIDQSRIHKTQLSDVYMKIVKETKKDPSKETFRERYFKSKKKIKGEITNTLIKFYRPKNVNGMALLTIADDKETETEQWIYWPSLNSKKRLSSSGKNDSFMGSDFSFSDIAGRQLDQDTHTLTKETEKYYYIQSIPKDKQNDSYSKIVYIIHKKTRVPLEVHFFTTHNQKLKILKNKKIKKLKGMYIVIESSMMNLQTRGRSDIFVQDTTLGLEISDYEVNHKGLNTI